MEDHHAGVLVCRAEYAVQDLELCVCLYAHRAGIAFRYELEIVQGSEIASCDVGQDMDAARLLFFCILSGGVTACHLIDVVQDMGDDILASV